MSNPDKSPRFLLLCVPGVDWRRINANHTPYLHNLIQAFPTAKVNGYGSVEVLSSTITGQRPHEHGIWQCRLKPERPRSPAQCCADLLPDLLTTTFQGIARAAGRFGEMATIPPRRRRRFEFHRMKFFGRADTAKLMATLASLGVRDSLLTAVGLERSRYQFSDHFKDGDWLVEEIAHRERPFAVFQFQGLDLLEHWYLEREQEFADAYAALDGFIKKAHATCKSNGITPVLLSAHGHERVRRATDLKREMLALGLPASSFTYYMESMKARFWFHTDAARRTITEWLERSPHGVAVGYKDLSRYQIHFEEPDFGELYFVAHPGSVFFPDDFYHPLANLYFALTNAQKRRRFRHPRLRGQHGYLPSEPSERGFITILEEGYRLKSPEMELRDVAPTVLAMLGVPIPPPMQGAVNLQ